MASLGYTPVSVLKKNENAGRPGGKKSYIIVFNWADITKYTRDEKGANVTALTFANAKKPIAVYATTSSINVYHTMEGEDDARGFIHHVDFEHPGSNVEVDEFLNNNVNARLGAIVIPCDGSTPRIAGTPCQPLAMTKADSQDNKEACKNVINLASVLRGPVLGYIPLNLISKTDNEAVNAELGLTAPVAVGV